MMQGAYMLLLLALAATAVQTDAQFVRGIKQAEADEGDFLPQAGAVPCIPMPEDWCDMQIAGCQLCYAPLPEFSKKLRSGPAVVKCHSCNETAYVFNTRKKNCDCAPGAGTHTSNGSTVLEDGSLLPPPVVDEPKKDPESDNKESMVFAADTKSSNDAGKGSGSNGGSSGSSKGSRSGGVPKVTPPQATFSVVKTTPQATASEDKRSTTSTRARSKLYTQTTSSSDSDSNSDSESMKPAIATSTVSFEEQDGLMTAGAYGASYSSYSSHAKPQWHSIKKSKSKPVLKIKSKSNSQSSYKDTALSKQWHKQHVEKYSVDKEEEYLEDSHHNWKGSHWHSHGSKGGSGNSSPPSTPDEDGKPKDTMKEQDQLQCKRCPPNYISEGGLIGAAICTPCEDDEEADEEQVTCRLKKKPTKATKAKKSKSGNSGKAKKPAVDEDEDDQEQPTPAEEADSPSKKYSKATKGDKHTATQEDDTQEDDTNTEDGDTPTEDEESSSGDATEDGEESHMYDDVTRD